MIARVLVCLLVAGCLPGCDVFLDSPNLPPVAVAGEDLHVSVGERAMLDGSQSYDPDGDELSYQWGIVAAPPGSVAELSSASIARPELVPDVPGVWIIRLVVSDGGLSSQPDSVQVRVAGEPCMENGDCEDEQWCNGPETCVDGFCLEGDDIDCDDGDPCTLDGCDEIQDSCVNVPQPVPGAEGPWGEPTCSDGIDNDCDGLTDDSDPHCQPCATDVDCLTGVACLMGLCTGGSCEFTATAEGMACEADGLFCNGEENCDGAGNCVSPGNPCPYGSCNETTRSCDGTVCGSDGDCPGGYRCIPGCASSPDGCMEPPVAVLMQCPDEVPPDAAEPPVCTIALVGWEVAGQADCLRCTAKVAPVVLDRTDFSDADGNCSLEGWSLVTAATGCSNAVSSCGPTVEENPCCDELGTLCDDQTFGQPVLRCDRRTNCTGGGEEDEEWRIYQTFDLSDLTDARLGFSFGEDSITNNEAILVYAADDVNDDQIFCLNEAPQDNVDRILYRYVVDLPGWTEDNPGITITKILHSEDNDQALFLDDIRLTARSGLCPRDERIILSEGFEGCDLSNWNVSVMNHTCPAENCSTHPEWDQGIKVDNGSQAMSTSMDISALDGEVRLCFGLGWNSASEADRIEFAFETELTQGSISAFEQSGPFGPDRDCREYCVNLSDIEPVVSLSETLTVDAFLYSTGGKLSLYRVTVSGEVFCQLDESRLAIGPITEASAGSYEFDVSYYTGQQLAAQIVCGWTGGSDLWASDTIWYRP